MNDNELLNKSLYFICELLQDDPSMICEALLEYEFENKYCAAYCQNLCTDCIKRYLKYYNPKGGAE